jgi:hypothetical protein
LDDSPYESWTSDRNTALDFSTYPDRTGEVVALDLRTVPPERVAADLRTQAGREAAAANENDPWLKGLIMASWQDAEVILWRLVQ